MLTAIKDFRHPDTGRMVRAGERVEFNREQEGLYRRLGAVRYIASQATPKPAAKRKRKAAAKK